MGKQCDCIIHLYHIFHIREDGDIWSHSQSSCDSMVRQERLGHTFATVPVSEYQHRITRKQAQALYKKYAFNLCAICHAPLESSHAVLCNECAAREQAKQDDYAEAMNDERPV